MPIQRTYWEGNPEDRNYVLDFWSWLQHQPQIVWLNTAREANWDQFDRMFVDMVRHPDCDRALASWLLWRSNPAYFAENSMAPPGDDLLGAILYRSATDGFPDNGLHYERVEVALEALRAAAALAASPSPPFAIPRELVDNFEGRNPTIGRFDEQTEADLAELYRYFDGRLSREDPVYHQAQLQGGNRWYEKALRLPAEATTTDTMTDVQAIDAVFGEHRAALVRIELARQESRKNLHAASTGQPHVHTNRIGMTTDPAQRLIGFALLGLSAIMLLLIVWAKLAK